MVYERQRPLDSYKRILNFNSGTVHIVAALPRKECGSDYLRKNYRVCRNFGEWMMSVWEMQEMYTGSGVRIYTTYNPRCLKKAAIGLLDKMRHSMISGEFNWMGKDGLQISALKKAGTAASRDYFMLDCDTEEAFDFVIGNLEERVVDVIKTPNGYHVLTKPFNVSLIEHIDGLEIKKDEFLFVDLV